MGIPFLAKGPITDVAQKLQVKLNNLSRVPWNWLKLPNNTKLFSFMHRLRKEVMGLKVLKNAILIMRKARLEKFLGCNGAVVVAAAGVSAIASMLKDSVGR